MRGLKDVMNRSGLLFGVLLLSGCASSLFPDFKYDNQVVINDGGRIEVRKVDNKGILVSDKKNAKYEDDETEITIEKAEEATPAKVEVVTAEEIKPIATEKTEKSSAKKEEVADVAEDNVKIVDANAEVEAKEESSEAENVKVASSDDLLNQKPKTDEKNPEDKDVFAPSINYLATTIYFRDGGAELDDEAYLRLKEIAKTIKKNNAKVNVYGFASSRTKDTDPASHKLANFNVSVKRAENTAKALSRLGVKRSDISTQALSDTMPIYLEVMPEGERLNRRAEIYLSY